MKIELDPEVVDEIVHAWLKDIVENGNGYDDEDEEFWREMKEACATILRINWFHGS